MNIYKITLKSDSGKFSITTTAIDADTAKFIVCEAENCPPSAIIKCKLIKRIY
jgi:hypothetical protein